MGDVIPYAPLRKGVGTCFESVLFLLAGYEFKKIAGLAA